MLISRRLMEGRVRELTNCLGAEVGASCPGHRGGGCSGLAGNTSLPRGQVWGAWSVLLPWFSSILEPFMLFPLWDKKRSLVVVQSGMVEGARLPRAVGESPFLGGVNRRRDEVFRDMG